MAESHQTCPKCNGTMEEGYAIDRGHFNQPSPLAPSWVEGVWVAIPTMKKLFTNALGDRKQRSITGYRCASCGYLESYAK